jgi:hypothetical protein
MCLWQSNSVYLHLKAFSELIKIVKLSSRVQKINSNAKKSNDEHTYKSWMLDMPLKIFFGKVLMWLLCKCLLNWMKNFFLFNFKPKTSKILFF